MLAIATTVVLPGTDPVNVCPVLCSRGNAAVTSFAKSFAEGSALAGEAQALGPDGKLLKDADGGVSVGSTKDVGVTAVSIDLEAKVDASAGAAVLNKGVDAKSLISVIDVKVVIPGPRGVKGESPEHVALLEDAKSNRDVSAAIQTEASEGQLSSDGVKDIAQELSSGTIDGGKTGGTGGASNPGQDSTASAMPCIPGNGEKLPIPNRKEVRIAEDKEEEIQAKKMPKDHDVVVKTGKAVKIEKPDKTGRSAANPVGIAAQAGMTVPVVVLPVGRQPTRTSAVPDEDDISFLASATIGPSLGANTAIGGHAAKQQAITAKPDVSETKAQGSSPIGDPASEKTGDDGAKASTPASPATVEGNSKPLNGIAVPAIALKHADGTISGMLPTTGPGTPIAPSVTGRTQVAVGSHAVMTQSGAGMQAGAGASDATID